MLPEKKDSEASSEETSEDTSREDTSSSDESTDESSDEGDKGASKEDKGEERGSRFFDPKKVPDELKPTFKAMQASFTRKMQVASKAVQKAQAFDELVANPEFQAWVASKNEAPSRKGRSAASDDDGDDGKDTPDIEAMIERAVAKSLAPIVQGEHRKNAQNEWKSLLERYPQAENYKDEIQEELRSTPGIGYEKAFKNVAFDDAVGMGSESAIKSVASKKKANTSKPSNMRPGDKTLPKPKSIPEAFQRALAQAKEKERG
jgi:hypothetical protein